MPVTSAIESRFQLNLALKIEQEQRLLTMEGWYIFLDEE